MGRLWLIDTGPVPDLRARQLRGEADTQEAAAGGQAVGGAVGALGHELGLRAGGRLWGQEVLSVA